MRYRALSVRSTFFVTLLGALTSCGGGDPSAPDPDPGPFTQVACPDLSLVSTSGIPLDDIPIGSLPTAFGSPVAAAMLGADDEVLGFGYVLEDSTTHALELSVPLHPGEAVSGGPVDLTFTDGTNACASVAFTILPLPAADGELTVAVDLLQAVLTEQATTLGTTKDELNAADLDALPPVMWYLALAQSLLDDDNNDASLRAVADGSMGSEALDLVDRLLARTRLRESLESPSSVSPLASLGPARLDADELICDDPSQVTTPELLNHCMELAAELARSATGISREVAADIQQVFSDLGGGRNEIPVAGEISVVFGAMFFIIYADRTSAASVFPSRLTSFAVEADPDPLREDDGQQGKLTATVFAGSLGYDMQQEILDGIFQAKAIVDQFGDLELGTGTVLDSLAEELAPQFEQRLRSVDIEGLQIPAQLFGPVSLANDQWLDADTVSGNAIELIDGATYEGREFGTSVLSVRSKDGKFGDTQLADQLSVTVSTLQVSISPQDTFAVPADTLTFTVTVARSLYPDSVEIDPSVALQGTADILYNNNGTHTVTYVAPAANVLDVNKPDLLTVRHTAQTGARGYSSSERLAISTILFGGISITTDPTCLDPGDTLRFEATVPGVPTPSLNWSASAGTIDSGGLFTAPTQPQIVTITVEYANDPSQTDSIQVNVGGCTCQATVQVAGQDLGSTRSVRFTLNSDSSAVTNIDWYGGVLGPQQSSANLIAFGGVGGTIPVDATGSWDADLAGLAFGSGYYNPDIFNDSIPNRVTLDITENDGGNTLAGTAAGQVYEVGVGIRSWSMMFRVEADPTYSTSTMRECRIE